ncbi:class I SAM-dependent methyltransferase [Caulobacter mirabilis]|uniref:SAM-dependent methyltransferase n=1 Tax=Caulobacter mirabilis TaxID=69666 RepID=A0A2D2B0F8_9CAUL|nr:methyltransferase domain-containing protein [Caulobacter mirabilis]ATQ43723.1 SAM-dependent methyltransferase [Caulobacter mirabilis]
MATDTAANAAQVEYWNAQAGQTWAAFQDKLDRQLEPLGELAMDALAPQPGDRVIDIGCGSGQTTLALAQRVGDGGRVEGVDISVPMLEIARRRAELHSNIAFLEADAQTHAFPPHGADKVFSRFGVMFFADPTAAFTNIHKALRPGGRLAFVCWRPLKFNDWMTLPLQTAVAHVPPPPPPTDPFAPGPFAFSDPDRVRGILGDAGFKGVEIKPHDTMIGGNPLEESVELALRVGPLGALLRENPDQRDKVVDAVRDLLAKHVGSDGVRMPGAVWIVTAHA